MTAEAAAPFIGRLGRLVRSQDYVNFCYRMAFRIAYPLAMVWWKVRGEHDGIAVAIWVKDRVLVVRHSYKPGLQLPGGGVHADENHRMAAARELKEELGLNVEPDSLRLVTAYRGRFGRNYLYEMRLESEPNIVVDLREIVYAGFESPKFAREWSSVVGRYLKAGGKL